MNNLDCKNNKISEVNASNLENKARFKAFTLLFFFNSQGGRMVALTVPSPFPRHARHPRHEERQQEEDDGVAEGVAHAVVEKLHAGLGPEEFRERVQCPIRETEDEAREREPAREVIHVCSDADVVVDEFRQQN